MIQFPYLKNLRIMSMALKQFEIWIAYLNSQIGTEAGKTRLVLIVQTNLLNKLPHSSTIVCPITPTVKKETDILRVHLKKRNC